MSQVIIPNGQLMGAPGPAGSPGVYAFADYGDPNVRTDPLGLLAGSALGSTYQRVDPPDATHALYVKTSAATGANPTGVWTNK
jgi:hypothetical protein